MTEQNSKENEIQDIPEAMVHTRRQISIVWLVPIVAILIGGWLAYKGLSEKGPMVTRLRSVLNLLKDSRPAKRK
jgi:paraquat-inducible protein B